MQKQKRVVNQKLIKEIGKHPCLICQSPNPDVHHIKTRGAFGDDVHYNLVPLCRMQHHREIHSIGTSAFAEKYVMFMAYLIHFGWFIDGYNKWRHGESKE